MVRSSLCLIHLAALTFLLVGGLARAAEQATVTVDAAKVGPPISKYIYGQFIEHLGRCIYGGIWAEMLEDRKFFYPVGENVSPWKSLGGKVTMARGNAFVGQHSPQFGPGADKKTGIYQHKLGLIADRKYTGRIWLAGSKDSGSVHVSLVWGDGPDDRQTIAIDKLTDSFSKTPLEFKAVKTTDNGRLEITSNGKGAFRIGAVSLMPADNVHGLRADTLALLKELDATVYRWPGGNFVSGYNWKDGIGADLDRRPPRKNPAWQGIEPNDFGLDEFIALCRELKTEPYIAVNSGLGDARSAIEEIEYANGGPDTAGGKLRAGNGHPEPYAVKFWSVGNEMYGTAQLGHISLERYMANYAQTVNVIGCIKTNKTAAEMETTGLVLKLYRQHFGALPVATELLRH